MSSTDPVPLKSLLGRNPRTEPLMRGEVPSDLVTLDFDPVMPVTDGFPAMVREMRYDFGELALLAALQARETGRKFTLLPFVLAAEYLHQYVHYNSDHGLLQPSDLAGKRIGVRSYTQTTGLWIRGFLEEDHGIPLEKQHWICFQDPHVAEYREPDFVNRAPADKSLVQMLLDGEIDVAVGLTPAFTKGHPQLQQLFPAGSGEEWSKRTGIFPINHLPVLKTEIHERSSKLAPELFRLLASSKRLGEVPPPALDIRPAGVERNRRGIELLIRWAVRQQLLYDPVEVDDLFDNVTRPLGATL